MRLLLPVCVFCCALIASPACGEPAFPYKAFVNSDDVYIRSGPGQSYYPTDKLKAGQEVEVYRHDPGGWYAIRPPEGSFSWVSDRFLKPGAEGLAVVTDDRVAARVGSRFSNIRDVIQVRLHKAEVVEVMEAKRSRNGSGTWYKIAPPSGEFRWVFGKYVDTDYPRDGVRKTPAADNPNSQTDPVAPAERQPGGPADAPPPVGVQQAADADRSAYDQVTPRSITPEQFRSELEEIDMELSVMVVEEPTVWEFREMWGRAEALSDQAETALERGRTRVLSNKIIRFEDIKRRYNRIASMREKTERSNRRLASLSRTYRTAGRSLPGDGRYDGVGQLTRVVSSKLDVPRYVLVDDVGEVRCYVTPAPGVNLRHYMGRRVGVNGTTGYMPEQRAHHVMARHVRALEDRRLR